MSDFGDRLAEQIAARGRLCIGVDPHPAILRAWGLPVDATGAAECARVMVEALGDLAPIFKPQSALFEAYGSAGVSVLERFLAAARAAGALVIMDAKRGDIGSTMAGYATAYLSGDSPLRADALTVSPYLGFGSLRPAIELAEQTGRGLYVLCRTSNPEGGEVQLARTADGRTVAQVMVDAVNEANAGRDLGPFGLVIGGTLPSLDVDLTEFTGTILSPGIGAQGGTIEGLTRLFGPAASQVLPNSSREIMSAGPDPDALRLAAATLIEKLG